MKKVFTPQEIKKGLDKGNFRIRFSRGGQRWYAYVDQVNGEDWEQIVVIHPDDHDIWSALHLPARLKRLKAAYEGRRREERGIRDERADTLEQINDTFDQPQPTSPLEHF